MSEVGTPRRYYLLQAATAKRLGDNILANIWRAKQVAQPGQLLPDSLMLVGELRAAGYLAFEDLAGADARELRRVAGIGELDAQRLVDEVAALKQAQTQEPPA